MRKFIVLIALVSISLGASKIQENFAALLSKECKKEHSSGAYRGVYCDCMGEAAVSRLALKFSDNELNFLLDTNEPNFRPNSLKEMDMANTLGQRLNKELSAILSDESLSDDVVECSRAKIGIKK